MGQLVLFLLQAVLISLSGVMAPGPVTAATLAAGTRSRHAGGLIAIGHGLVEFPLMLLILAGLSVLFTSQAVIIVIGLAGGGVLILMGAQILASLNAGDDPVSKYSKQNPVWIGIVLSAGNPYFLIWWATVGLALTGRALEFGRLAFALFAVVHWLCDLVWLEALSQASFRGTRLLGDRIQRVVLVICSLALIGLGLLFMGDAAGDLIG